MVAFHLLQEEEEEYLSFNKCLAAVSSHLLPVCRFCFFFLLLLLLLSFLSQRRLLLLRPIRTRLLCVQYTHTHTIDR